MIIAYRADDREPDRIKGSGGFYPKIINLGLATDVPEAQRPDTASRRFALASLRELCAKGANNIQEHVITNMGCYVSAGLTEDCGGHNNKRYLYKMTFGALRPQPLTPAVVGGPVTSAPFLPVLHLDGATAATSTLIALVPARSEELTFLTFIPLVCLTHYRAGGEAGEGEPWLPMP